MKWIKKLLILILSLILLVMISSVVFMKSVEVKMTNDDLPQTVYESNETSLIQNRLRLFNVFMTTDTQTQYTIFEEFLNYYILYLIRDEINEEYDPLSEDPTDQTLYIYKEDHLFINYIVAKVVEDSGIELLISFGSDVFSYTSVLHLFFDIKVVFSTYSVVMTLQSLSIKDKDIPFSILDKILNTFGKDNIENAVTEGTLDLEEYTYTVNVMS